MRNLNNRPIKLLLVEDEETILNALNSYFIMLGYEVDCAKDRTIARLLIENNSYAIALIDMCLTNSYEMEGLDIIKFIKKVSPLTKIVAMSGNQNAERILVAQELGIHLFLNKPQRLFTIAHHIKLLLETNHSRSINI